MDIGEDCDILISNDKNYNVDKAVSRLNLIKVLISNENDSRYDICLDKCENYSDKLMGIIKENYL